MSRRRYLIDRTDDPGTTTGTASGATTTGDQRVEPAALSGAMRAAIDIADQTTRQLSMNPNYWTKATIRELAALIEGHTAASDMLLALREMLGAFRELWDEQTYTPEAFEADPAVRAARAAIAKATGGAK